MLLTVPNILQLDKVRLAKERDAQLDNQSSRYEERLVELHSVIAELTRQLEVKARESIDEEEEDDDDDSVDVTEGRETNGGHDSEEEEEAVTRAASEMGVVLR